MAVPPAPELPEEFDWPTRTVEWWQTWRDSALTDNFTATDWQFAADTALVHAAFWSGETGTAGELRARLQQLEALAKVRGAGNESKGTPLDEFTKRRAAKSTPSRTSRTKSAGE